jgi:hypothetical protein
MNFKIDNLSKTYSETNFIHRFKRLKQTVDFS